LFHYSVLIFILERAMRITDTLEPFFLAKITEKNSKIAEIITNDTLGQSRRMNTAFCFCFILFKFWL